MLDLQRLQRNLAQIQTRIAQAAARAGRRPETITLVAVTKQVSAAVVDALLELGVRDIGENRVPDAQAKYRECAKSLTARWHMIGHLQRNKVKDGLAMFAMIHSVDTVALAQEIAARTRQPVPVLLEVNVSGEESKNGFRPEQLAVAVEQLLKLKLLAIQGLMTMAPQTSNLDVCRYCFRELAQSASRLRARYAAELTLMHLSMGMSQDFEVAIEEGATIVRIGTALLEGVTE